MPPSAARLLVRFSLSAGEGWRRSRYGGLDDTRRANRKGSRTELWEQAARRGLPDENGDDQFDIQEDLSHALALATRSLKALLLGEADG